MADPLPLLSLPYLCQKVVLDYWNPLEFFYFARMSRKTLGISTMVKKRMHSIQVCCLSIHGNYHVLMQLPSERGILWNFCSINDSEPEYNKPNSYVTRSSDKYSAFLALMRDILYVFKSSSITIFMRLHSYIREETISGVIDILNSSDRNSEHLKIEVNVFEKYEPLFQKTLKSLTRNLRELKVSNYSSADVSVDLPKFKVMNKLEVRKNVSWLDLNFILQVDPETIRVGNLAWTSNELNQFLRSWMEGKMRLKQCEFHLKHDSNIKEIVKGLNSELMDPRTNVKTFHVDQEYGVEEIRVHGGIYIRRDDGQHIIFPNMGYWQTEYHKEEVPREVIDRYEEAAEDWNREDVQAMNGLLKEWLQFDQLHMFLG